MTKNHITKTLSAPSTLVHYKGQLEKMNFTGEKEIQRLIALAECDFRLGVHPETTSADAIKLLQAAIRIDGTNPKYAYHLGCIELRRGRFHEAGRWFRIACCLAPTSHRIWAHVALLQRELNEIYRGDEKFEPNILLARSESILLSIQNGEDNIDPDLLDFVPPESLAAKEEAARQGRKSSDEPKNQKSGEPFQPSKKVKRYTHSGKCRWSGIDHLYVEQVLIGRATQSNVKKLTPTLQGIVVDCQRRNGGPAGMAILLVQWIISGYPVETVRRLVPFLPENKSSTRMLTTVCEIYENDPIEVPERITRAIENGVLPSLIGALIHRHRLNWQPLEFRAIGAHRTARQLLAQRRASASEAERDEQILETVRDLEKRIMTALERFKGSPPKQLKDVPPAAPQEKTFDGQALMELFSAYEAAAAKLLQYKDEGFRLLKEKLETQSKSIESEDQCRQVIADQRAAEAFLEMIANQTTNCQERFQGLTLCIVSIEDFDPGADFATRKEECISHIQGLSSYGKFFKVLKRISAKINTFTEQLPTPAAESSAEWSTILAGLKAVLPDESDYAGEADVEASIGEKLIRTELAAQAIVEFRDRLSEMIRTHLTPATKSDASEESQLQASCDTDYATQIVQQMETTGQQRLEWLDKIRQTLSVSSETELPDNFDDRLEVATNQFRTAVNCGSLKRRLAKVAKKLPDLQTGLQQELGPTEDFVNLSVEIESLLREPTVSSNSSSADSPSAWLTEATEFVHQLDHDWKELKSIVANAKSDRFSVEQAESTVTMRVCFDEIQSIADMRIMVISELRQSGNVGEGEIEQLEEAENLYLRALKVRGKFIKKFTKSPESVQSTASKNSQADVGKNVNSKSRVGQLDATRRNSASSQQGSPLPQKEQTQTPVDRLAAKLKTFDYSVDCVFSTAREQLLNYPQWIQMLPPFRSLSRRISGRQAETIYRLGRRRSARVIWNRMLREDRLDIAPLKNIAVCDTINGDVSRSLQSWKEYLEMLYLFDVIMESPREPAAVRSRFHRAFGNAFAPAFLSKKFDSEWSESVDPAALISFLSDKSKVRNFIHHRRLEYLNSRFEYESPSLVLGIKRVEAESLAESALQTMLELTNKTTELIPGRSGVPFKQVAEQSFMKAAELCADQRQMTLQASPHYDDEEKKHISHLVQLFDLQLKLVVAFRDHANMIKNVSSLDFITELAELNQIPLEISPELFPIVANTMGLDPETLLDLTSTLKQNVVFSLLQFLLADDDSSEQELRQRQYQVLVGPWLNKEESQDLLRVIDNPSQFMPEEALQSLQGGAEDVAITYLRRWNDNFPAMGGLCVWLVNMLLKRTEINEAWERLQKTKKVAFYYPTQRTINFLMIQILLRRIEPLMESEQHEEAFNLGLQMIQLDDCQAAIITQILPLYVGISQQHGKPYQVKELRTAIVGWIQRAKRLVTEPEEESQLPLPTENDIQQVEEAYADATSKVNQG